MVGILPPGLVVDVDGGGTCRIERLIGGGGQGEVYRATWDGQAVAIKWYYPDRGTVGQLDILERLIAAGAPDERFLWPIAIATRQDMSTVGYLMPLRDQRFANIGDLLTRRVATSFRALAAAGAQLAEAFFRLHGLGLCYRDISHGNVFIDPTSGDVLICDNDNIGPVDRPSNIGGTMRYMAPEVVRGVALPSAETDRYSLAVLLFTLLMNHHPLDGRREAEIRCFNEAAMRLLYGEDPLFIWDPENPSNRPDDQYQTNARIFWHIYPEFLKKLFLQAFTVGLRDPARRVTEGAWRKELSRLYDSIVHCPACGRQSFHQPIVQSGVIYSGQCWGCRSLIPVGPRIRIGDTVVILEPGAQLYRHHLDPIANIDFSNPVAQVVPDSLEPSRPSLLILSGEHWAVEMAGSAPHRVEPGQSTELRSGMRIRLGKNFGEVRF